MKKNRNRVFSSRTLSVITVLIFLCVMTIMFAGGRYMDICIEKADNARRNSEALRVLGEKLADASDYLTDEARRYSVTGDITHLYNYWHEVCSSKTRDGVIEELYAYGPPSNESELLEKAKQYSDMLIKTETISMKLRLISDGKTSDDYFYNEELLVYVRMVEECELPTEYEKMSREEMGRKAEAILYDAFYNESKSMIISPIKEFQSTMAARLNKSEEDAANGIAFASYVQVIGSVVVIILVGVMIIGINYFYINPIERYSDTLSDSNIENNISSADLSGVRVVPGGSAELYRFGEVFNHLSLVLYKELKIRAQAEEDMRIAKEQADNANEAKTQFFAQMSHELRTPLNAVTGYLYLLEKTDLNDEQKKLTHGIGIASDNLLGLINNVLDFSKIESGNMTFENVSFDLCELLNEVYEMMEQAAKNKGIGLEMNISENIPEVVSGDPLRLRQVLINLVGNAVKFTEKGNVIISAVYMGMNSERYVVEFGIRDSGIGIKKEDIGKIFSPFIQSDEGVTRKYGGTGLGLPIADMIVKGMSRGKYHIIVSSEKGIGSYFRFKTEFEKGAVVKAGSSADMYDIPQKDNKILLVDDNIVNLDIEREILSSFGLNVITAQDGNEALRLVSADTPDLILLDLHMPGMDGYETAEKIREGGSSVPIIALTADVVSGTREKIIASGMDGYLTKPFKAEKLQSVIYKYLGHDIPDETADVLDRNTFFSIEEALKNLGGKSELLYRVIKKFMINEGNSDKYAEVHIKKGRFDIAKNILHDIKGMAGNMCCYRLCAAAEKLHGELMNGKFDSLEDFKFVWDNTVKELDKYISAYEERNSDNPTDMSYDKVKDEFLKLCSEYDISASDWFEKYSEVFRRNIDNKSFESICEAVSKYDFESAAALCERTGKNV
ncbi:MAG: response regulator [Huintestinicola sp.]